MSQKGLGGFGNIKYLVNSALKPIYACIEFYINAYRPQSSAKEIHKRTALFGSIWDRIWHNLSTVSNSSNNFIGWLTRQNTPKYNHRNGRKGFMSMLNPRTAVILNWITIELACEHWHMANKFVQKYTMPYLWASFPHVENLPNLKNYSA